MNWRIGWNNRNRVLLCYSDSKSSVEEVHWHVAATVFFPRRRDFRTHRCADRIRIGLALADGGSVAGKGSYLTISEDQPSPRFTAVD